MTLRRITLAAALALVPVLRAADANLEDWLHDALNNRALWLYGSNNLGFETAPADLPPRTPGKRWVLNSDGRTAAVVYFVPGDIQSVEVDTHRTPDATGDFTLSVSADGKFWRPLAAVAAPLEDAAGWQFRLLAADVVPPHQMHLRVEFPAGATAKTHRLTEVWVRFKWDETLVDPAAPKNATDPAKVAGKPTPTSSDASAAAVVAKPAIAAASASTLAVAETAPAAREATVVFGETKPTPQMATPSATEAVVAATATPIATAHVEAARTQGPALPLENVSPATTLLTMPPSAAPVVSAPSAERAVARDASAPIAAPAPDSAAVSLEAPGASVAVNAAVSAEHSPNNATLATPRNPAAADRQTSVPAAVDAVKSAAPAAPAVDAKPEKPAKKKCVQRGRIGPRSK